MLKHRTNGTSKAFQRYLRRTERAYRFRATCYHCHIGATEETFPLGVVCGQGRWFCESCKAHAPRR